MLGRDDPHCHALDTNLCKHFSIKKAKSRLRTSSTRTCDVEEAVISHSTIQNKAYEETQGLNKIFLGIITPCILLTDNQLSAEDEPESPGIFDTQTLCCGYSKEMSH